MEISLEGGAWSLRPWREGDAEILAERANDRKIWLNLRDLFPHPYTLRDAREYIARARERVPSTSLAIVVEGQPAGGIGIHRKEDVERVGAELGYWLAPSCWGRGIATEAVRAMTTYAFATFPLSRIFALPYASNPASARVLEKAGFRLEGVLRRAVVKDGVVQDQLLYARTDQDGAPRHRSRIPGVHPGG